MQSTPILLSFQDVQSKTMNLTDTVNTIALKLEDERERIEDELKQVREKLSQLQLVRRGRQAGK